MIDQNERMRVRIIELLEQSLEQRAAINHLEKQTTQLATCLSDYNILQPEDKSTIQAAIDFIEWRESFID